MAESVAGWKHPPSSQPFRRHPRRKPGPISGKLRRWVPAFAGMMACGGGGVLKRGADRATLAPMTEVRLSLRLLHGGDIAIGPGKAELLEAIAATGSISAAGRRMGLSYRRAWLLVDTMNRAFAAPLVTTAKGGSHGGARGADGTRRRSARRLPRGGGRRRHRRRTGARPYPRPPDLTNGA